MQLDPKPTAEVDIAADPEIVFDHLIDPRTYPEWLVGAQRIEAVDDDWPLPGARFHHRVGFGPVHINDTTTVESVSRPDELVLLAAIGPLGRARATFRLSRTEDGGTHLAFEEVPQTGAIKLLGRSIAHVAMRMSIWGRNRTSLQSLKGLIEASTSAGV